MSSNNPSDEREIFTIHDQEKRSHVMHYLALLLVMCMQGLHTVFRSDFACRNGSFLLVTELVYLN